MRANKTGNRMAAYSERGLDFYPTPPIAVHALMRAVRLPQVLWEPCCGDGAIVKVLRQAGHTVIAQDLVDYGCPDSQSGIDFLMELKAPPGCDTILTNPPFMHAEEFITKGLELVLRVIVLCRMAFIEAQSRRHLFEGGQFAGYYPFINRLPMMHRANWEGNKKEASSMGFAWYAFDRDNRGRAKIQHLGFSKCKVCKQPFVANAGAITCSDACRQKQYRKRRLKQRYRYSAKGVKSVTQQVQP